VPEKLLKRDLLRCLAERGIQVDAMYLFGSRARGNDTSDSDIDVLLISPSFASKSFWARCALVGEAIGEVAEPVQIYPVNREEFQHPEPGGFVESILGEIKPWYKPRKPRTMKRS
jgi:predicted nucleotidyltransferase